MRLSIVNYTNTIPFIKALDKYNGKLSLEIIPAIPSECVRLFKENNSDVSLLPVAALSQLIDYKLITDYGIGCDGAVRTVKLLSNKPVEEISKLFLDHHSRTSAQLIQILLRDYWKSSPEIVSNYNLRDQSDANAAILAIGDKVITLESQYNYQYDLGEIWKKHTGLPFVFAVWVAKTKIADQVETELQSCFDDLETNLESIKKEITPSLPWTVDYFTKQIKYKLTEEHKKGMQLFLELIASNTLAKS